MINYKSNIKKELDRLPYLLIALSLLALIILGTAIILTLEYYPILNSIK